MASRESGNLNVSGIPPGTTPHQVTSQPQGMTAAVVGAAVGVAGAGVGAGGVATVVTGAGSTAVGSVPAGGSQAGAGGEGAGRVSNVQRIQQKKAQVRAWPRDKKLEKLAIYSSCRVSTLLGF